MKRLAEKHDVSPDMKMLKHDFVLSTDDEAKRARDQQMLKEAGRQNGRLKISNGVLVPVNESDGSVAK